MSTEAIHAHDHHTPTGWKRWAYSTNHKDIGTMYLIFAIIAGVIVHFWFKEMDLSILIEHQVPLLLNINKQYGKSTSIKIHGL